MIFFRSNKYKESWLPNPLKWVGVGVALKSLFNLKMTIISIDVGKDRALIILVMITKDWRQTSNQSSGGAMRTSVADGFIQFHQFYSAKLISKISCLIVSN